MIIEEVNNSSPIGTGLDAFIKTHSLTFNGAKWLSNYSASNIVQCAILNNNREIIGCFVYYKFTKLFFKVLITPPFAPHIELFYKNPSESTVGKNTFDKEIMAALAVYFDSQKADHVDLNLPQRIIDTQPFTWKKFAAKTRYSYLIDLSFSEEQLKTNLSSEKRKSLNKAQKDGLQIKESVDYKLVYELVIQSLERNNLAKNLDVIRNILFKYASKENAFAFVAYNGDQAIGASFCVTDHDKAVYLFGGFDAENKHHGAGVSCLWHSILNAKKIGLKYFDFEGSMNVKIERYFREFGGKLEPYFCVEKTKPLMNLLLRFKR